MAQIPISVGTIANDGTGTNWRTAWQSVQTMMTDIYALQSRMVNAGDVRFSGEATTEAKIQAAITQAVLELATIVFVPADMLPYDASLVTFNASVRMVREGGDWTFFDWLAYGATGDGVVDDTIAVQAALTAASGGGTSFIPQGTFLVTSTLTVPDHVQVVGTGWGSVLKTTAVGQHILKFGKYCKLSDFKAQGSGATVAGQFAGGGIIEATAGTGTTDVLRGSFACTIERLWVTDTDRYAINLNDYTAYITVRNCLVTNIGTGGLYAGKFSDYHTVVGNVITDVEYNAIDCNGVGMRVEGNTIRRVGALLGAPAFAGDSHGIIVYASATAGSPLDRFVIRGNTVEDALHSGIRVYTDGTGSMTKAIVADNQVTGSGTIGIVVEAGSATAVSNHHTVTGNHSWSNTSHGMYIHAAADCHIADNDCWSNGGDGIRLYDGGAVLALRNSVVANRCTANTGYGLHIEDVTTRDTAVIANVLLQNSAGEYLNAGDYTRTFGNKVSLTSLGSSVMVNQLDGSLTVADGTTTFALGGVAGVHRIDVNTGRHRHLNTVNDFAPVNVSEVFVRNIQVIGQQGAAVADATDAASAITQLNLLLARCRAHGLIAT